MDVNTNAYRIVKALTNDASPEQKQKRKSTSAAGRVGGQERAKRLTADRRHEIAVGASEARWKRVKVQA